MEAAPNSFPYQGEGWDGGTHTVLRRLKLHPHPNLPLQRGGNNIAKLKILQIYQ
jgi:hypothetical protein